MKLRNYFSIVIVAAFAFVFSVAFLKAEEAGEDDWYIEITEGEKVGVVKIYGFTESNSEVVGRLELSCVAGDHLEYKFKNLERMRLLLTNGLDGAIEGKEASRIEISTSDNGQVSAKESVTLSKFILKTLEVLETGYNDEDYLISVSVFKKYMGVSFSLINFAEVRAELKKNCVVKSDSETATPSGKLSESDEMISLLNPDFCKRYLETTPYPGGKVLYPLDKDKFIAASTCSASGGMASLYLHALKGSEINQNFYYANFESWKKKALNYYSESQKKSDPNAMISVIMNIYKDNLRSRPGLIYSACVVNVCNRSGL